MTNGLTAERRRGAREQAEVVMEAVESRMPTGPPPGGGGPMEPQDEQPEDQETSSPDAVLGV